MKLFSTILAFALLHAMSNAQEPGFPASKPRPVKPDPYFTFNYGFKDLSKDGKFVLTSEGMWSLDERKWVWQTWFWPEYRGSEDEVPVHLARFTPDGKNIVAWRQANGAVAKRNQFWLVESTTGKTIKTFATDSTQCFYLAFSAGGKHLFVNGGEWQGKPPQWVGCIHVWGLPQGKKVREIGPAAAASTQASPMTISSDGKYLFCGSSKAGVVSDIVQMWDVAEGKVVWHADGVALADAFSPDGKHVIYARGTYVQICDIRTGKRAQALNIEKGVVSAVFDKSGKHILVGTSTGVAELWNLESGAVAAKLEAGPKYDPRLGPRQWFLLPEGERILRVESIVDSNQVPLARMTFSILNLRSEILESWGFPHGLDAVRLK